MHIITYYINTADAIYHIMQTIHIDCRIMINWHIHQYTRAEIVGRGTTEKIAHAYAYGGPNMAVKSLEKLMNVPILCKPSISIVA
jgi:hypothetical protein